MCSPWRGCSPAEGSINPGLPSLCRASACGELALEVLTLTHASPSETFILLKLSLTILEAFLFFPVDLSQWKESTSDAGLNHGIKHIPGYLVTARRALNTFVCLLNMFLLVFTCSLLCPSTSKTQGPGGDQTAKPQPPAFSACPRVFTRLRSRTVVEDWGEFGMGLSGQVRRSCGSHSL